MDYLLRCVVVVTALTPFPLAAISHLTVANHVFLVFAFGPLAMLIAALRPAAFVTLAGAVWIVVSPWLLGYTTVNGAWINELISGSLLAATCIRATGVHRPAIGRRRRSARTVVGAPVATQRSGQRVPSRS